MTQPTINLNYTDLEDAIVERLRTATELEDRCYGADTPLVDIDEFPNLPLVFVTVSNEGLSSESQPIGRPLVSKVDVYVEVTVIAETIRGPRGAKATHPLCALVKDKLQGWQPDLVQIQRPLKYDGGNQFDNDDTEKLTSWITSWVTMTLVKEVPDG